MSHDDLHLNPRHIFERMGPADSRQFTEVPMSRPLGPAGVVAAILAATITLLAVCVPMSTVWFNAG